MRLFFQKKKKSQSSHKFRNHAPRMFNGSFGILKSRKKGVKMLDKISNKIVFRNWAASHVPVPSKSFILFYMYIDAAKYFSLVCFSFPFPVVSATSHFMAFLIRHKNGRKINLNGKKSNELGAFPPNHTECPACRIIFTMILRTHKTHTHTRVTCGSLNTSQPND